MIEEKTPAFWRATLALCLGSFMVFSNVYVTQPLLPEFQQVFGITTLQANWSLAIVTLMLGLSLLVYGPLSDALGRRPIMLATLSGVVITTLALSQITDYSTLVFLRAVQGFFLGGLPAIALAYMGDEFRQKAMALAVGIYISANTLGGISGRLFSGLIADWFDWRAAFISAALVSAVILLVFWRLLPPSQHFEKKPLQLGSLIKPLGQHLRNPRLLPVYLIGGLNFFIFINLYSYVTFLLAAPPWNLSSTLLGMLFVTYLSGTLAASLSGRVALRFGQAWAMMLGVVILIAGTLTLLIPSVFAILAGLLINSFGFFLCHSSASAWVSREATQARASANSLYLVFYYLGASSGGFYLDPFWRVAQWPGVVFGALLIFSLTLAMSVWLWRHNRQPLSQLA